MAIIPAFAVVWANEPSVLKLIRPFNDPVFTTQLQQVLMNLMLNGIDAMKYVDRGGELTIASQQAAGDELLISVSDTGIGVPKERASQIFDAFFSTKPHGVGMGLPISRSIIESHGGRLWADADSTVGASFHFVLPTTLAQGDGGGDPLVTF